MHRFASATAIGSFAILLSACGTTAPTVAPMLSGKSTFQETRTSCSSMSGLYLDDAQQEPSKPKPSAYPSLSRTFNVYFSHLVSAGGKKVTEISFPQDFNGLEVNGYDGTKKVVSQRIAFGDRYNCVNGQLVITLPLEGHTEGRTYSIKHVTTLSGGSNRDLTGHRLTSGYSRYLFIPYSESGEWWFRFVRVQ